ncbi:MAG: hypothetical protein ACJ75J_08635 [Cytophagaceae bacterium]
MEHALPIAGCILLGIGAFLGLGFLVKFLWNKILPNISGLKRVTYLQALGILILARLLFGGVGYAHGWGRGCHNNDYHCSQKWDGCKQPAEENKNSKMPE